MVLGEELARRFRKIAVRIFGYGKRWFSKAASASPRMQENRVRRRPGKIDSEKKVQTRAYGLRLTICLFFLELFLYPFIYIKRYCSIP
ncbi:MAG: hypothetical protein QXJ09_07140 [Candidatus Caldarchaeum sp.]